MYIFSYLGLDKYTQEIYNLIMDMFDTLPLACILNGKILCIHGGISHELQHVSINSFSCLISLKLTDFTKYPKLVYFVTYYGQIQSTIQMVILQSWLQLILIEDAHIFLVTNFANTSCKKIKLFLLLELIRHNWKDSKCLNGPEPKNSQQS
jgi:hypothetical protein